jgi:NAD(P)-dependent dehydrogenase (short-subunit alcohol dehydrogenase family)
MIIPLMSAGDIILKISMLHTVVVSFPRSALLLRRGVRRNPTGLAAYSTSKLMDLMAAEEMARRFARDNIRVFAVHPGMRLRGPVQLPPLHWLPLAHTCYIGHQNLLMCCATPVVPIAFKTPGFCDT